MTVALIFLSLLVFTVCSILLRPRRPQKPRLEVLPHDAGAEAFAAEGHRERMRRDTR